MSFLADFGAGFFNDQARQMQQAEQLSIAEAVERRRMKWEEERAERKRKQALQDQINLANVQAEPTPAYDREGRGGLLLRQIDYDPETGKMSRREERIGELVMRPTGKQYETKTGGEIVTEREYSDGLNTELREYARAPRQIRAGGESTPRNAAGLTPYQQQQIDERERKRVEEAREKQRAEVKAAVNAELQRLDSLDLEPKDFRPDSTGVIKAGDILQSNFDLPRDIRSLAQARKALREKIESEMGASFGGAGGSKGQPPPEYPNARWSDKVGGWVVQQNGQWFQVE